MGKRRKFGRAVNGVVVIDKPHGMTSNDVVQRVKRLFFANKVGHTGSLDPLATGVLPICLGEATKFSQYLLDSDKSYVSEFTFGEIRSTGDADGEVVASLDASQITEQDVKEAMGQFVGAIKQVPPMYSALKKDGQPLYKLARQGIEVEREARQVNVYKFDLLAFVPGHRAKAKVFISCSKGTYVRSLAEDMGSLLNVGAHVSLLRRTQAGQFGENQALLLTSIEQERGEQMADVLDHHLMSVDSPVSSLAKLELDAESAYYFSMGQAVMNSETFALGDEGDKVRIFSEDGVFLGVGEITGEGLVAPKRLVVH